MKQTEAQKIQSWIERCGPRGSVPQVFLSAGLHADGTYFTVVNGVTFYAKTYAECDANNGAALNAYSHANALGEIELRI